MSDSNTKPSEQIGVIKRDVGTGRIVYQYKASSGPSPAIGPSPGIEEMASAFIGRLKEAMQPTRAQIAALERRSQTSDALIEDLDRRLAALEARK